MPSVLEPARSINEEEEEILFTDTARPELTNYNYTQKQHCIMIENIGDETIFLAIESDIEYLVHPMSLLDMKITFNTFSIRSLKEHQKFKAITRQRIGHTNQQEKIKILQMNENPILNTYNSYASVFSIIELDKVTLPWFHSSFIQICYDSKYDWYFFENHNVLDACIWLKNCKLTRETIQRRYNNVTEFVIESIDSDYYAYFLVNPYYISAFNTDQQGLHEILIFGYDVENEWVYIANNFENGKYIKSKCTFQELEASFQHVTFDWVGIHLYKKNDPEIKVKFNREYVIRSLKAYLEGTPSLSQPTPPSWWTYDCVYGVEVYNKLISQITAGTEQEAFDLDVRAFHLFWEHKKCMVLRIQYMIEELGKVQLTSLWKQYEELQKRSFVIRNVAIKYNFLKNKNVIQTLINGLQEIMEMEKIIIRNIISILEE
ncbi:hypothetical protein [Paenibacillus monticola]|uniref:Butirosin biosynthesis protein H N-terminal domain-containing protein n=1 Tax=Paenibacillus monticola TaxID=2666075 RepID=A0A7X2L5Q3_9BACL|nr:hypothetical protein [Paenibacillus monticola]MRN57051.1 hypothetical protein [Paenibacillus monticola]